MSKWSHKEVKGKTRKQVKGVFNGQYKRLNKKRQLLLTREDGKVDYPYESHEAAKRDGWKLTK